MNTGATQMPGAWRDQKAAMDSLKLELQIAKAGVQGIEA